MVKHSFYFTSKKEIATEINNLASKGNAFLFLLDFEGDSGYVVPAEELQNQNMMCCIKGVDYGVSNVLCETKSGDKHLEKDIFLNVNPISLDEYKVRFDAVQERLKHGDTYLLNLTFKTRISGDIDLKNIYNYAIAPYKLLFEDKFTFYSPESFIQINDQGFISSFPMKGTIDATMPNAQDELLNNEKELFEHYTIVDLIRNDLSMVARNVRVKQFRYIDEIVTDKGGKILQTSSEIVGELPADWKNNLGDIILTLLPAGSICGAPKAITTEIIKENELSKRGFYTGVMGVFNGTSVDSCVIIRYIEKDGVKENQFYYRSGGGITSRSDAQDEYNELISKIYVPII